MTQILVGATNTSGKGSAADLTVDNGTQIILDQDSYYQAGYLAAYLDDGDLDIENLAGWGAADLKEISITDGDYSQLTITDFVDVAITDGDYESIIINQAKRATIDLSDSDQGVSVYLTPYSNNDHWSNLYQVTMGSGDDYVSFSMTASTNPNSTKWTEFDVDLGDGDDTFDYALKEAASDTQQRSVDGGDGFDSLLLSGDNSDIEFVNFEYVELEDGETLTLTEQDLINNSALEQGLIVNGRVTLSDDFELTSMSITELTDVQRVLVEQSGFNSDEIVAVNLYTGDDAYPYYYEHEGEYTLLMKESDIDYSTFKFPYNPSNYEDSFWADYGYLKAFGLWDSYSYDSTQWLSFNGGGSRVSYDMAPPANDNIERIASGLELYLFNDVNTLDFSGFETIVVAPSADTLELTSEKLAANNIGIIFGKADVIPTLDSFQIYLNSEHFFQYSYLDPHEYGPSIYEFESLDESDFTKVSLELGDNIYTFQVLIDQFSYATNQTTYRIDDNLAYDDLYSFNYNLTDASDTLFYSLHMENAWADSSDVPEVYAGWRENGLGSWYDLKVDGEDGFDTLVFEESSDYLDFSNFEYIDVQFDGVLKLDQILLANNASADDGLIVNSNVELLEDIHGIFVDELSDEQQALFDSVGVDSDEYSAVTVYYGEDSYTLLMDVDDLSYHLAA